MMMMTMMTMMTMMVMVMMQCDGDDDGEVLTHLSQLRHIAVSGESLWK